MSNLLSNLRAQRENTIERLTILLLAEERFVAAWLFGSLGRGEEDDLSDIDVWIVVRDEDCESVVADRQNFVAQIGEPVIRLEARQNAPPYGGYLLAQYAHEEGLQQVDWYWQPQSYAKIPSNVRLLFDRANLPHSGLPPLVYQSEPDTAEYRLREAQNNATFFWSMASITAKYIARRDLWHALGMISMLRGTLRNILRHLNAPPLSVLEMPPANTPETQLTRLRDMAEGVLSLHPVLEAQGGEPPSAVVPYVFAYFDLIEKLLKENA